MINIDEVIYTARMVACKQMERYDANCSICYHVAIGGGVEVLRVFWEYWFSPRVQDKYVSLAQRF